MYEPYMEHSGIKGMHWGIRRYQNPDGSLTPAGRSRYGVGPARKVKTTVGSVVKGLKRSTTNAVSRVKKIAATRKKKSIEKLIRSGDVEKLAKKASKLNNSQLDDAIARANKISAAKNAAGPKKDMIDKIERVIGTMDKTAKMAKNIYDYKNAKMEYKKRQQELFNMIAGVEEPKKKKGGDKQNRDKKPNQELQNARDESNKKVEEAIANAKKVSYGERVAADRDAFAKKLAENAKERRAPSEARGALYDAISSARKQAEYDRGRDYVNRQIEKRNAMLERQKAHAEERRAREEASRSSGESIGERTRRLNNIISDMRAAEDRNSAEAARRSSFLAEQRERYGNKLYYENARGKKKRGRRR